jgi:hypothetical protein
VVSNITLKLDHSHIAAVALDGLILKRQTSDGTMPFGNFREWDFNKWFWMEKLSKEMFE